MSNDFQNQNNKNEDIDLLVLFNYIGDKINSLFRLFGIIFKWIYATFIFGAKAVIENIKLIVAIVVIAGGIGYYMEQSKDKVYDSGMLVRTYFGSKYQLATNLNYYNALLESEDYGTLAEIFEIHPDTIAEVTNFDMIIGPETENERIKEYDRFIKSIDSIRAQDISFDDYVENRDMYSGNLFEIKVESHKRDIFERLEVGINKSFENIYSIKEMMKRDSMIVIKRQNILNSIEEIDSLKKVYIKVIENESQNAKANIAIGEGFPLMTEKSQTKEFQLLDKEISLRNELRALEEEKLEENVFFDVISSFQVVGNEVSYWYERYTILLPFLSFLGLGLIFLLKKFTVYVKNYGE